MQVSYEINTEKGDTVVVSLVSSYDFLNNILHQNSFPDIEIIDVSIVRKSGDGVITMAVLKEIVHVISEIMQSSPNAILFYYCDSSDPISVIRKTRKVLCQEYRDRLFSLMFARYTTNSPTIWYDYRIETTINDEPQFIHLIYRENHKNAIDIISREVYNTLYEVGHQK